MWSESAAMAVLIGWQVVTLTLTLTIWTLGTVRGQVKLAGSCPNIPALRPFNTHKVRSLLSPLVDDM